MKVAFIGFGVVGRGLAEILASNNEINGVAFSTVAVSDVMRGTVCDPDGLDLQRLLDLAADPGTFEGHAAQRSDWDALQAIRECGADIVVEVTPTDIVTGQPAMSHVTTAIESGKHVVTTNKGPVVLALNDLLELAARHGVQFRYEGTVMSGTPVLNTARRFLAGCGMRGVRGILNGTTNYILCEMESGMSYADALEQAQALGYAETIPDADVEGKDALGKVVILANVLFGARLSVGDVPCEGITRLTLDDIAAATAAGERWKLIGEVERDGDTVVGRVQPVRLPVSNPLAAVSGPSNAITFSTDLLGEVTIAGPGAGKEATGFALLSDMLEIARGRD